METEDWSVLNIIITKQAAGEQIEFEYDPDPPKGTQTKTENVRAIGKKTGTDG